MNFNRLFNYSEIILQTKSIFDRCNLARLALDPSVCSRKNSCKVPFAKFFCMANMIFLRVLIRNSANSRCSLITSTRFKSAVASAVPTTPEQPIQPENHYHQTPGEVYEDRVKNNVVMNDTHQRDVIAQFDHLHERLHKPEKYVPPSNKKPNILTQLFFGGSLEEKKIGRIPRGVYVWGTVGGGELNFLSNSIGKISR